MHWLCWGPFEEDGVGAHKMKIKKGKKCSRIADKES